MIDAFLFDIGRVLVHFDFDHFYGKISRASEQSSEGLRARISPWITEMEAGGLSAADFVARGVELLGGAVSAEEFAAAYMDIFSPNEQMWPLVERVAAKVPVWLFSNISALHETWVFRQYPVVHHAVGGFYSWRCGCAKPAVGIYEQAMVRLGVAAERIGYVDDLGPNIAMGEKVGWRCHHYAASEHEGFVRFLDELGL